MLRGRLNIVYIFLLATSSGILYGQQTNSADSLESKNISIPFTLRTIDSYVFNKISFTQFAFPDSPYLDFSQLDANKLLDEKLLKSKLLTDFKQYLEWQKNYDLGMIGKILGYAMTATAAGLAVQHVIKYKGKAFFGK